MWKNPSGLLRKQLKVVVNNIKVRQSDVDKLEVHQ